MKFVKKTVATVAISALLLTGCTVMPPDTDPTVPTNPSAAPTQPTVPQVGDQSMNLLTAARVGEIEDAWYLATSAPLGDWCEEGDNNYTDGVRYYGTYDGYDILFRPTGMFGGREFAFLKLKTGGIKVFHWSTFTNWITGKNRKAKKAAKEAALAAQQAQEALNDQTENQQ